MKLTIKDSHGNKLNLGDWVKVSGEHYRKSPAPFAFYVQVQIKEGKLIPFQNFAYDQIEKVSGAPNGIEPNKEGVYFVRDETISLDENIRSEYYFNVIIFEQLKNTFFTISE